MSQQAAPRDNQGVKRPAPRPIPARVRILAAILAVACVGLAIVGSVTFLVQRERVINEIDNRLRAQVSGLQTLADPENEPGQDSGTAAPGDGAATASEILDIRDFTSLEDYLREAVTSFVPARNEASLAVIDGVARYKPGTISGFDISQNTALIERAVTDAEGGESLLGTVSTEDGSLRYISPPSALADR